MPLETKTHVLSFLDTLPIYKEGLLYNQIIRHIELYNTKNGNPKQRGGDEREAIT